jgi:hypothetical protein
LLESLFMGARVKLPESHARTSAFTPEWTPLFKEASRIEQKIFCNNSKLGRLSGNQRFFGRFQQLIRNPSYRRPFRWRIVHEKARRPGIADIRLTDGIPVALYDFSCL